MATYINTTDPVEEENNIQFIPCGIDFSGRAKVSAYFKEKPLANGTLGASFRGRPLFGSEIHLPEGYSGYVLDKPDGTLPAPQVFDVRQSFKSIKYWNLDRLPSKNDSIISALDWLDISKSMHARERADHLKNGEAVTNGNSTENDTHNSIPN